MIDTLVTSLEKIKNVGLPFDDLEENGYAVVTLHRPVNVDDPEVLERILGALQQISERIKLVIPFHPRTKKNIEDFGLIGKLKQIAANAIITGPIGYLEMLRLNKSARLVITDSGGIQEETTYLRVPCITMRENTERPATLELGTNVLVGNDLDKLRYSFDHILSNRFRKGSIPRLWDGKASQRIVNKLISIFLKRTAFHEAP